MISTSHWRKFKSCISSGSSSRNIVTAGVFLVRKIPVSCCVDDNKSIFSIGFSYVLSDTYCVAPTFLSGFSYIERQILSCREECGLNKNLFMLLSSLHKKHEVLQRSSINVARILQLLRFCE